MGIGMWHIGKIIIVAIPLSIFLGIVITTYQRKKWRNQASWSVGQSTVLYLWDLGGTHFLHKQNSFATSVGWGAVVWRGIHTVVAEVVVCVMATPILRSAENDMVVLKMPKKCLGPDCVRQRAYCSYVNVCDPRRNRPCTFHQFSMFQIRAQSIICSNIFHKIERA